MRFLPALLVLSLSALALSGSVASASASVQVDVTVNVPSQSQSRPVSDKFLSTFEPLLTNRQPNQEAEVNDALGSSKGDVSWLARARGELGVREIAGSEHNPRIVAYWNDSKIPTNVAFKTDEGPWNAAFVGAILERSGIEGTRSGLANSYSQWGTPLSGPAVGAVVVVNRGAGRGLVGFVVGRSANGGLMVLGGNQNDSVSVMEIANGNQFAFRWPAGSASPSSVGWNTLPLIRSKKAGVITVRK